MYEIFLVSHTSLDWRVFSEGTLSALKYDPRIKRQKGLLKNAPSSIVEAYSFETDCFEPNPAWDHVFMGFMTLGTEEAMKGLISTNLAVLLLQHDKDTPPMLIITGSVRQWRSAVIEGSKENQPKEYRQMMNRVYSILQREKYGKLFKDNKPKELKDETFTL